jgi:hypothetical protein
MTHPRTCAATPTLDDHHTELSASRCRSEATPGMPVLTVKRVATDPERHPPLFAKLATERVVDRTNAMAVELSALLSIHRVYPQAPVAGRTCGPASHGERSLG